MRAIRIFFLFLFVLHGRALSAQDAPPEEFIRDSLAITRVKLIRPQFKFDNRVSFNERQGLKISGFDLGVLLSEKLRVTIGYYGMKERLEGYDFMRGEEEFGRFAEMKYGSLNTELIYKDARFLSLGMPLEIGAGYLWLRDKNVTTGEILLQHSGGLLFVNFGMSATFKPMRFLGLKGIIGYRKTAFNQVEDFDFDGFFTAIGLNVDLHAIISEVKMFRLMKKYHRGNNVANLVDIITD